MQGEARDRDRRCARRGGKGRVALQGEGWCIAQGRWHEEGGRKGARGCLGEGSLDPQALVAKSYENEKQAIWKWRESEAETASGSLP